MLGKAVEGAWTELGWSLAAVVHTSASDRDKFRDRITGRNSSFSNKIEEVLRLCKHDVLKPVLRASGIRVDVERIGAWSHVIREARNAIHFNVRPPAGNNYEEVAALLLGAKNYLGAMHRLKSDADNLQQA